MDTHALEHTAHALLDNGRGLLALDESTPTCGKRFADYGIENTETNRRDYRALLLSTPGLSESVSGAILYDETLRMYAADDRTFVEMMNDNGLVPGIKVDTGAKPLAGHPGEQVTEGLDGLRERLAEYHAIGARFAKWRAVITIGDGLPTVGCLAANSHALARYAGLCQEAGIVPIVEPEVMLDGAHDITRCLAVTDATLTQLFSQLHAQRVHLPGLILKASMVLSGLQAPRQASVDEVAEATLNCLYRCVPAAVAGVAFLSGGQSAQAATAHLDAMSRRCNHNSPWPLSFSFARALQQPALEVWHGDNARTEAAQAALRHRARCNRAAALGLYDPTQERNVA